MQFLRERPGPTIWITTAIGLIASIVITLLVEEPPYGRFWPEVLGSGIAGNLIARVAIGLRREKR